MMTQIAQAFQKAQEVAATKTPHGNTKVSFKERIWNYVKDHPGTTTKTLEAVFKGVVGVSATSFHLNDMVNRGMVEAKKSGKTRAWGGTEIADNAHYYHAIGHTFVLRERKTPIKKSKVQPAPTLQPTMNPPAPAPAKEIVSKPPFLDIENMKVKDARELFNNLKTIFGA